jgi:hypothetical protein
VIPENDKYRSPELPNSNLTPERSSSPSSSSSYVSASSTLNASSGTPTSVSLTSNNSEDIPSAQEFNVLKGDMQQIGTTLQNLQANISAIAQELASNNNNNINQ